MDLNLAVLAGRLTATADLRVLDSGARLLRLLVAVRSEEPQKRLDVVPVVWWEPDDETLANPPAAGERLWITGSIQRRFWDAPDGRRSRLEIVAQHVTVCRDESVVAQVNSHVNGP